MEYSGPHKKPDGQYDTTNKSKMVQMKLRNTIRIWTLSIMLGMVFTHLHGQETTLRLAVTSDVHGAFFPYDFLRDEPIESSLSSLKSFADSVRKLPDANLILLDNGDLIQGTPASYYANFVQKSRSSLIARVMNYLEYDAGTVGNHDIEAGPEVYYRLQKEFQFPWLGANIIDETTGAPAFLPYAMIERNGIRIAVLGLITPGVPGWLPRVLWPGLQFDEMVSAARQWVSHIEEHEKPDVIVGLLHTGMGQAQMPTDGSYPENAGLLIAKKVPGLDVIFLGHDHRPVAETLKRDDGTEVQIVNPGSGARNVGFVELTLTPAGQNQWKVSERAGKVIPMATSHESIAYNRKFRKDIREIKAFANRPVGRLEAPLFADESLFGNSAFTDLIHRAQLDITGAQVSFTAPLTTSQNIEAGDLLTRDLFTLYRYENFLYVMELTGKEIRGFLEHSYGLWFNQMKNADDHLLNFRKDSEGNLTRNNGRPSLAQASFNFDSAAGIRYTVDVSKPAGERISIQGFENGDPFDERQTYKVAINSYRGSGGGGHLTEGAGIPHDQLDSRINYTSGTDIRSLLMDYLKKEGKLHPKAGTNWKVVPEEWAEKGRKKDQSEGF
jgi:2',3'-cyclic-nucleotide 2'-phosphodiesterase/3'-nucleotidase